MPASKSEAWSTWKVSAPPMARVMVRLTGALVEVSPRLSVATAVRTWVPTGALAKVKLNGALVEVPILAAPAK